MVTKQPRQPPDGLYLHAIAGGILQWELIALPTTAETPFPRTNRPYTREELAELAALPIPLEAAHAIWIEALTVYCRDCLNALRGASTADLEALDDFTGSRELLANLCRPLDLVPEWVAKQFEMQIAEGVQRQRRGKG
ncbi:hypothetical protein BCL93_105117 [Onishia taeanensis]|uniref:Uncharacterized protein n=1 Tax=Onishia taeanensis TaxID=284577 RepID=A0A328XNY3_9GAMM|nr:hypothetical protein [Halomonas taeanensis]RAR61516.1 hypothetical protein BCL93_105117 [Halomonas taeanensis]